MKLTVANHGSLVLLRPEDKKAIAWLDEHLPSDRSTFGNATVVEPRYVSSILEGFQADGGKVVEE